MPEIKITSVTSHPALYGANTLSINMESKYIKDIVLIFHPSEFRGNAYQPDIELRVYAKKARFTKRGDMDDYESLLFPINDYDGMMFWVERQHYLIKLKEDDV